jgi:hypothetical protein
MIRGLYGKLLGVPIPPTHEVTVSLMDLQQDANALHSPEVQDLLSALNTHGQHRAFGRVLDILYAKANDDPDSSLWFLRIHRTFGFFGFTMPREAKSLAQAPTRHRNRNRAA